MSAVKNALIYLSIVIIENMLLPQTVEKFNLFIEVNDSEDRLFFLHALFSMMGEIYSLMPLRINKILIIDRKKEELETLREDLEKISTDIQIYDSVEDDKFLKQINKKETERFYGGDCPNLVQFWPPKSPYTDKKVLISEKILSKKGLRMFTVLETHKNLGMIKDSMEKSIFNNSIHN